MELDAPIDNGRLAIEDNFWGLRRTRVWAYATTHSNVPLFDNPNQLVENESIEWTTSAARRYLGGLVLPGYVFEAEHAFAGGFTTPPSVRAYAYTRNDVQIGRHEYYGDTGASNLFPSYFKDAVAPPCTAADARLLGYNVQTYHTAKIGLLIALLEQVVPEAV